MSFDYKKQFKELYNPKPIPSVIDVPEMLFIQISRRGNPNGIGGEYQAAVEALYALSYTIKMMAKSGETPRDYFEYVVPPLEGLWWLSDNNDVDFKDKSKYCWTSMIRQPEFVTQAVYNEGYSKMNCDNNKSMKCPCTYSCTNYVKCCA